MYRGPFDSSKRVKIESPFDFVMLTADIDVPKMQGISFYYKNVLYGVWTV